MKRFILSLTAAAVLSMPMAASALEKMDNNQLKSATGQAGVSIAVDDVVIYQSSIADTTYWDTDGFALTSVDASDNVVPAENVGAAGIKIDHLDNMQKLTTIDAILDADTYGTEDLAKTFFMKDGYRFDSDGNVETYDETTATWSEDDSLDEESDIYTREDIGIIEKEDIDGRLITEPMGSDPSTTLNPKDGSTSDFTNGISPLTIDVGTCKALTAGWKYNTDDTKEFTNPITDEVASGAVAGVIIGLPTVEISTYNTSSRKTVSLELRNIDKNGDGTITQAEGDVEAGAMNEHHNTFLEIEKTGTSTMAILGGRLEIAPH